MLRLKNKAQMVLGLVGLFSYGLLWGQDQSQIRQFQISPDDVQAAQLKNLTSGRPIITGTPNYQQGIKFSNTSGSALTFQDGTTQNTSANSLVAAATVTTSVPIIGTGAVADPVRHSSTAITAGIYGTASSVPTVIFDKYGHATGASNTSISITESQVTNLPADLTTINNSIAAIGGAGSLVTGTPWNATCNGTTDDSTAIQNCVNASSGTQAPCMLPPSPKVCVFGNLSTNSHVALTHAGGMSLVGYGNVASSSSTLRFDTDGGGKCSQGTNGLIQVAGDNNNKVLSNFKIQANSANTYCLINASSSGQIGGLRVEGLSLYPAVNPSTITAGIVMGNLVSDYFFRNYFSVGLSTDVWDAGTFTINTVFDRNKFDILGDTNNAAINLGSFDGGQITNSTFEQGPKGIVVTDGSGVTISNNWMGDTVSGTTGTWITYKGGGGVITANSINNTNQNRLINGVQVYGINAGHGGNSVTANYMDSALVDVIVYGNGNLVQGNKFLSPTNGGVQIASGSANTIGPNETLSIGGGGKYDVSCATTATGNYIIQDVSGNNGPASNCEPSNLTFNLADQSLSGPMTLVMTSTFGFVKALNIQAVTSGSVAGTRRIFLRYGSGNTGVSFEENDGSGGVFRNPNTTYGDLLINNENDDRGNGNLSNIRLCVSNSSICPFRVGGGNVSGNVYIGSGTATDLFDSIGDLFMNAGSSIILTGSTGWIIAQSSIQASNFFGGGRNLIGIQVTTGQVSGVFSDGSVNITTNGVVSGKFGDNRVGITTGATTSGQFAENRVLLQTFTSSVVFQAAQGINVTYGIAAGSASITNGLTASSGSFTATGANQYSIVTSSGINMLGGCINFSGGGIQCTAAAGAAPAVSWVQDNFLGQVNGAKTAFTLSSTPSSNKAVSVILDGLLLSGTSDYTYDGVVTITLTTAPASACTANPAGSCTSSFFAQYTVNTSTLPSVFINNSNNNVTGYNTWSGSTNVYNAASITVFQSSLTVNGNGYFGGSLGIGTTNPAGGLEVDNSVAYSTVAYFAGTGAARAILIGADQNGTGQAYIKAIATANNTPTPFNLNNVVIPSGNITTGQALCLDASKNLGHCTSAVGAGGACTCTSP